MLLAAEAWGTPPWQIDPRPTPRYVWLQRWRLLTRLRAQRQQGDAAPPAADNWDWSDF